jgi:ABC-type nitrate/sulfonate/bicarbonate transport system substrate-binding protein
MILFRKHLLSAAFFPGAFVFIVFNINSNQQQKQAGPPEKITITCSTAPNAILMAVVLSKDYFTQEGLDVTPQLHTFRKPALCEELSVKRDTLHGIRNDLKWL